MTKFDLTASGRHTDAAQLLEYFLDNNNESIAPNLFGDLNDLAGEIETVEFNYKAEIDELRDEKTELEQRIEELEKELEELNNDN
jgi:cell division protein FtsB